MTVFDAQLERDVVEASFDDRVDISNLIAGEARADAHVLTGEFRDGIAVEVQGLRTLVVDNDEEAIWKEYGTVDTSPQATLTTAASRYGSYTGWKIR
ncbi:hypothetical protein CH300_20160 [Rhodococcus sp. 15-1154-1]|nr:hypothetical protein CH300_20160 [Rhodococcus sp. 15-1154-1]